MTEPIDKIACGNCGRMLRFSVTRYPRSGVNRFCVSKCVTCQNRAGEQIRQLQDELGRAAGDIRRAAEELIKSGALITELRQTIERQEREIEQLKADAATEAAIHGNGRGTL